ncbi:MAG: hypothetical protein ACJ8EH_00845, partial [Sphingomicrobium sp.]
MAFTLVLVGAGAAVWGLAHYEPAARFLGIAPATPMAVTAPPKPATPFAAPPAPMEAPTQEANRIAALES